MKRIEFETIEEVRTHLKSNADCTSAVFQGLDLKSLGEPLGKANLTNALFLGCSIPAELFGVIEEQGGTIFPKLTGLPFNPYRNSLYTPEELLGDYEMGGSSTYKDTLDGRVYQHFMDGGGQNPSDVAEALARRLHDLAISDALYEKIEGRRVVAIMGGHSLERTHPFYQETARLSRELTHKGYLLASGGGPGAMEATHLGAWFAPRPESELDDAIAMLSQAPLYTDEEKWLDTALTVVEKYPVLESNRCESIGIPTWLYGHEPPTCFALSIAKYFANSVREDGLLAIAKSGIVFAPGSAGTIQEIFQDAAQNHYKTFDVSSPMIMFGEDFWTREKPVYPLLKQLADEHDYGALISISDSREEIIKSLDDFSF
jgi:predicted Rossmann-fold nucleotide-binding protein